MTPVIKKKASYRVNSLFRHSCHLGHMLFLKEGETHTTPVLFMFLNEDMSVWAASREGKE